MTVKASVLLLFTLGEIGGEIQISQLNKISELNEIKLQESHRFISLQQDLI